MSIGNGVSADTNNKKQKFSYMSAVKSNHAEQNSKQVKMENELEEERSKLIKLK